MSKPLGKREFTTIYQAYLDRYHVTEAAVGQPQVAGSQDLAPANPPQVSGQPAQPANTPEMKEFTDALTKLGSAISKFKDPKMIEQANQHIQQLLAKKPGQANAPVSPVAPVANQAQAQSPAGNNLAPQG